MQHGLIYTIRPAPGRDWYLIDLPLFDLNISNIAFNEFSISMNGDN